MSSKDAEDVSTGDIKNFIKLNFVRILRRP